MFSHFNPKGSFLILPNNFFFPSSLLFSDSDYLSFKELYYPDLEETDPFGAINLYQRRLIKNRYRENGSSTNKKLAEKLVCGCGRSFSYLAGIRYHLRHECGRILKCKNCGKVYTDKSNLVKHVNVCTIKFKRN